MNKIFNITVCVRRDPDGELSPFDAAAYEAALRIPNAQVTLLSMGPSSQKDYLLQLTRLGAKKAVLLSDPAFAGSDTLATAYVLSQFLKKDLPDLIFCGRQTLVGDTGQTGPMLSQMLEIPLFTGIMEIEKVNDRFRCRDREGSEIEVCSHALITFEKSYDLRLPSILSKAGEVVVLGADEIDAEANRCGLVGSPTRVVASHENVHGKRKCKKIKRSELIPLIEELRRDHGPEKARIYNAPSGEKLNFLLYIGHSLPEIASSLAKESFVSSETDEKKILSLIQERDPDAVIWSASEPYKSLAARVAAQLKLGLCADCTELAVENNTLWMIRPALSGRVIAKIQSLTRPAMATVHEKTKTGELVIGIGYGAKEHISFIREFAESIGAEIAASRKIVDHGVLPYALQVGLTGRKIAPKIYLAIGISGAVHHLVGMESASVVIAINPDPEAPIFEYADYGICEEF